MTQPSTPSGDLAIGADRVVLAGQGRLMALSLFGGSAASTIIAYDNATASSGTVLARFNVAAGTTWSQDFGEGVVANNGITVVVTGTAAVGNAYYIKG